MDMNHRTRGGPRWHIVYPNTYYTDPTRRVRVVILINTALSTNIWSTLRVPSPDIIAISVNTNNGLIHIFNIYNDQANNDSITLLLTHSKQLGFPILEAPEQAANTKHLLWAGDFNCHYRAWDEERNAHLFTSAATRRAEELIDATTELDLHMLLPHGIPTLQATTTGNHTRPDNVFGTTDIAAQLIRCDVASELTPPSTDHFPITIIFDTQVQRNSNTPRRNFKMAEPGKVATAIAERITRTKLPEHEIQTE